MDFRIAYMTGQYPRSSDVFIQREIAALRAAGVTVKTISIRRTSADEHVGPEQREEAAGTFNVLPCSPFALIAAHAGALLRAPGRWFRAAGLAWRTRSAGASATLRQAAYFLEAGLVARHMRRSGLSHLHNHFADSSCFVAMLASAMGGFSYSFTLHGPAEFFDPVRLRLDEKVRQASFVACISHFCRSQAMIWTAREDWDRLHIIHCGVDASRYSPRTHDGTGSRLVFVGRLAPVKGLPVLFDALATVRESVPGVHLTIVGDGPDRAMLEDLSRRHGLADAIEFAGRKSRDEVAALLEQADVFVLPSFAEGVPVVLMEAMAAGLPVVTTRIAGVPELVEDGVNGLLAPPGDSATLADHICTLLNDAALRARLGSRGRAVVQEEFNTEREAAKLLDIMLAAVGGSPETVAPNAVDAIATPAREPSATAEKA